MLLGVLLVLGLVVMLQSGCDKGGGSLLLLELRLLLMTPRCLQPRLP